MDVGGLYPSWSADMQEQMPGLWLFCCAGRSNRSGQCKVASFAPHPNPIKASKKISNVIRAMMGSLQPHFPCPLAAGTACSVFPVGSVITSRKFCTLAHQETGAYWFKGFPVIVPAPDHCTARVAGVEMLRGELQGDLSTHSALKRAKWALGAVLFKICLLGLQIESITLPFM